MARSSIEACPKVSIILPVFNGQKYLLGSVASCLLQTFTDLELVIVDDGSTDGTGDILSSIADPRVHRIRHQTNRKLPAALNTGFAVSRGEYLTWTSDDNQYALNAIQTMVDYLDGHPDADFVFTGYWVIDGAGAVIGETMPDLPGTDTENDIVGACFMYRRDVFETIGDYNESRYLVEDFEYWLRVDTVFTLARIDRSLYFYRVHDNSLSAQYGQNEITVAAAKLLEPRLRRKRLSLAYERTARYAYCHGQKWKAARHLLMAIYYQPVRLINGEILFTLLRKIPKFFRHL